MVSKDLWILCGLADDRKNGKLSDIAAFKILKITTMKCFFPDAAY